MSFGQDYDYAYSGNEGSCTPEYSGPTASGEGPGPYSLAAATGDYGFCEFCRRWTYADRWHGSCADCRWRWTHYPDTYPGSYPNGIMPAYADMPRVCSFESCNGTESCTVYGDAMLSR